MSPATNEKEITLFLIPFSLNKKCYNFKVHLSERFFAPTPRLEEKKIMTEMQMLGEPLTLFTTEKLTCTHLLVPPSFFFSGKTLDAEITLLFYFN